MKVKWNIIDINIIFPERKEEVEKIGKELSLDLAEVAFSSYAYSGLVAILARNKNNKFTYKIKKNNRIIGYIELEQQFWRHKDFRNDNRIS